MQPNVSSLLSLCLVFTHIIQKKVDQVNPSSFSVISLLLIEIACRLSHWLFQLKSPFAAIKTDDKRDLLRFFFCSYCIWHHFLAILGKKYHLLSLSLLHSAPQPVLFYTHMCVVLCILCLCQFWYCLYFSVTC